MELICDCMLVTPVLIMPTLVLVAPATARMLLTEPASDETAAWVAFTILDSEPSWLESDPKAEFDATLELTVKSAIVHVLDPL